MRLNLPILDLLADSQSILIAGAGGGFDVYAGLPLYFALREAGKQVHLANYSFTDFPLVKWVSRPLEEIPSLLLGARGALFRDLPYFPEGHLAQWFLETQGQETVVWMLKDGGVEPLKTAYKHLVGKLGVDALILVDGGVDSLMRGDEAAPGTLVEDSISLAAAESLDVPLKLLACVGFGTEVEEGVNHHHALENIAALTKDGGFYGTCSLTPQMPAFQQYEAACRYAWEGAEKRQYSHISTRIIPAVRGEFGDYRMYRGENTQRFVSPLMGLYWFFDARAVMARSLVLDLVRDSWTKHDALRAYMLWATQHPAKRPRKPIPY